MMGVEESPPAGGSAQRGKPVHAPPRTSGERGSVFSRLPPYDWLRAAPYIRPHGRGEGATGRRGTAHGKRNQRKEGQRKKIGQNMLQCYRITQIWALRLHSESRPRNNE
jgi:hypothetical protein